MTHEVPVLQKCVINISQCRSVDFKGEGKENAFTLPHFQQEQDKNHLNT